MTTESKPAPEIVERLLDLVAKEGMVDRDKVKLDAELDTLGVKSADVVMILVAIEDEFGTYIAIDSELSEVKTVGELVSLVAARIAATA
ncbi:acyl carrier protein [Bosea sp. (in: a-proteobacteria)]|jgi:acyl carrier protein|uniref:acyl carrier protein n=1 Tax=Bosea sp. (in: a-proteobacteria) TaxID=1871050 RepID=UPI003F728B9A